jgi:hypothetical protein
MSHSHATGALAGAVLEVVADAVAVGVHEVRSDLRGRRGLWGLRRGFLYALRGNGHDRDQQRRHGEYQCLSHDGLLVEKGVHGIRLAYPDAEVMGKKTATMKRRMSQPISR